MKFIVFISQPGSTQFQRIKSTITLLTTLLVAPLAGLRAADTDKLQSEFVNPPAAARPWVYWWWLGRVSQETITRDLEALKAKGIGGMVLFQCDDGILPDAIFGKSKRAWSPEWAEMVRFANVEAKRLGLDFIVTYGDGSTGCSGPWIDLENSGQIIVHSGIRAKGGSRVEVQLPQPEIREGFYRDVAVIAYPVQSSLEQKPKRMINAATLKVSSMEDFYYFETEYLLDGDTNTIWTSNAGRPGGEDIDVTFPEPFTTTGVFMIPRNGWTPSVVDVQVSDDGKTYRSVAKLDVPPNQPVTLPVPATTSRWFRIGFPSSQSKDGRVGLAEFRLLAPGEDEQGAVSPFKHFAEQIGNFHHSNAGLLAMSEAGNPQHGASPDLADTAQVLDLSSRMDGTGKLSWNAPDGEWEILRFGRSSIGWRSKAGTNGSGNRHADYLNAEAIRRHFTMGIDPLLKAIGQGNDLALSALHEDSFEMPYNRWTASFPAEFKQRRGYDLLPWLPVLTGRVVESLGASERFLWDYRRTIADLFSTHWAMAQKLSHERGLKFQSEAAGPSAYCFDGLAQLGRADIPMGEFWSGIYQPGVAIEDQGRGCWPGPVCETIRQTASAAHIYGRPIVAAESFTGYSRPFVLDPFDIKAFGDRAYCDGLNRNVIHLFMTQPIEEIDGKPVVVRLHAFDYNIRATWFEQSRFWTEYLARCSSMLQQGRSVADICCFLGEGAPSLVPQREFMEPKIPDNYDYDACNAESLLKATVREGRVCLPGGGSYAVLSLPPAQRAMTPAMLGHLRDLVRDGATVSGPKPQYSPSLTDHVNADREVRNLANEMWGEADAPSGEHAYGRGRVFWSKPLAEVLAAVSCPPAFTTDGAPILFAQRHTDDAEIFFLSNQMKKAVFFTGTFRAPAGSVPELWDPATGQSTAVAVYRPSAGQVEIPMHLDPRGSVFVVLRPGKAGDHPVALQHLSQAAAMNNDLTIQSATYGIPGDAARTCVVTEKVAAAVSNGALSIRAWFSDLGVADPAPGIVKILTVKYTQGGKERCATAPDAQEIQIQPPPPSAPDYMLEKMNGQTSLVSWEPGKFTFRYLSGKTTTVDIPAVPAPQNLSVGWELTFESLGRKLAMEKLVSWTTLAEEELRCFSGTVTYRKGFKWNAVQGRVDLDLGELKNIAIVTLNGQRVGLLWKPPFRMDISSALKEGENKLEIQVINLLVNRIHGDFALPAEKRHIRAFGAIEQYRAGAAKDGLLPSGLLGPVAIRGASVTQIE